jgi:hypothetical protein
MFQSSENSGCGFVFMTIVLVNKSADLLAALYAIHGSSQTLCSYRVVGGDDSKYSGSYGCTQSW